MLDSTQFDSVAPHYHHMPTLPEAEVLDSTIGRYLQSLDLNQKRVLDLACGTGRWTRFSSSIGAREVVAVDISPAMVEVAVQLTKPHDSCDKVEYHVADCTQPLVGAPFTERFDVVLAVCFLNYAPDEPQMRAMWTVIADNLKPGGKLVALVPNLNLEDDFSKPIDPRYGTSFRKVESVNIGRDDWGIRTRFMALTGITAVEFDMYRLNRETYKRTAAAAGLREVQFLGMQYPVGGHPDGFWDEYKRRPHYELLTASR